MNKNNINYEIDNIIFSINYLINSFKCGDKTTIGIKDLEFFKNKLEFLKEIIK